MKHGKQVSNRFGGNQRGRGQKYRGAETPSPSRRVFTAGDKGYGTASCPKCGFTVGLNKDGKFRNHRVGPKQAGSWPCPGSEHAPPTTP